VDVAANKERELAEMRGRYLEVQHRLSRLEQELDAERRRAIRLEVERDLLAEQLPRAA
jgi:hypothetical protein